MRTQKTPNATTGPAPRPVDNRISDLERALSTNARTCHIRETEHEQRITQLERAEESRRRQAEAAQQWAHPMTKLKAAALAVVFVGVRIAAALRRRARWN